LILDLFIDILLSVTSLADIQLELAAEEAEEAVCGIVSLHEMSASVFLSVRLDLEQQQYVFHSELIHTANDHSLVTRYVLRTACKDAITPNLKAALQEKRNVLQHRITLWRQVQILYMPGVSGLQAVLADGSYEDDTSTGDAHPETLHLWLPSELPEEVRQSCSLGLLDKEVHLCQAQADDALHHVRRQIHI